MKIKSFSLYHVKIPYKKEFKTSVHSLGSTDRIVVKVVAEKDFMGVGETSTILPEVSGETIESILEHYDSVLKHIVGMNIFELNAIGEKMDSVRGFPCAKAAVDIALHDLMARVLGLPVYALLGGKLRDRISVGASFGYGETLEDVALAVEKGFLNIKLKVGGDPRLDVKRVKAVRENFGKKITIRVDANAALKPQKAIRLIKALEPYEPLLVEQPVMASDLEGMAKVSESVKTPILADESILSSQDAAKVASMKAADIISTKTCKGGLTGAKAIVAVAEAHNYPVYLGSLTETGIGNAAGAHLGSSIRELNYPSDIKGPLVLKEDLIMKPMKIEKGYTYVPQRIGLGVELNEDALKKYSVKEVKI